MNNERIRNRIIKPVEIEVENRGGYDVLMIEDSAGNRYTTLRDEMVDEIPAEKKKYIGESWEILWEITRDGYINFHGFVEETENEPNEEQIRPEDYDIVKQERLGLSETDIRITRQSAGHDASRIVAGKLSCGERLSDKEIEQELRKWADKLKQYYRTGEWGDNQ